MSINSRNKGANGERELARILGQRLGVEVKRNLEQSRSGGHDLDGLGLALEVKRHKTASGADVALWWLQAVVQGKAADCTPVLAYRANRAFWRFVVPLETLMYSCYMLPGGEGHVAELNLNAFCVWYELAGWSPKA